jgi:cyclophilin family peptidyl-prolyl cis-trans isomerase
VDGEASLSSRLLIELYAGAPLTTENFRCLCTGERGVATAASGRTVPLWYQSCPFHRLIPGFMIQGGDIVAGDGLGCVSIYGGGPFRNERFLRKHDRPGLLSMANNGPDSNGCQVT